MATSRALLEQGDATFRARDYAAAREQYREAAEVAAALGDKQVQVEALSQVARCWSLVPDLAEGRAWLRRAEELASPEEPQGWTRYLGVRGIFEREEGDKARAMATFVEMYNYAMARGLYRRAIDAAHHVAIVAPPEDQITWSKKGIEAAEALGEAGWLGVLWNNLGWTYFDAGDLDQALTCLLRARDYHHQSGDALTRNIADRSVGHVYLKKGALVEARTWLAPALVEARRQVEATPNDNTSESLGMCLWDMGDLLAREGNPAEGLTHLREARALLVGLGIGEWWAEGLSKLDARISEVEAVTN